MGWSSKKAINYYQNGLINRKQECDAYFYDEDNYEIVRSTMVGVTYYAAVRLLNYDQHPVVGFVISTKVDQSDYFNFSYKVISEDLGPAEIQCPDSILNELSETDSEYAIQWRNRCRKFNQKKEKLNTLRMGSQIIINRYGKRYILTKSVLRRRSTPQWICWSEHLKFRIQDIIEAGFQIYKNPENGPEILSESFLHRHYEKMREKESLKS